MADDAHALRLRDDGGRADKPHGADIGALDIGAVLGRLGAKTPEAISLAGATIDPAASQWSAFQGYVEARYLPISRFGARRTVVAADPAKARGYVSDQDTILSADPAEVDAAILRRFAAEVSKSAANMLPDLRPEMSARGGASAAQRCAGAFGLALAICALAVSNEAALLGLAALKALALFFAAMRVIAMALGAMRAPARAPVLDEDAAPEVALFVPLYQEAQSVAPLLAALSRLRYPAGKLRATIIMEADDHATQAAFEAAPKADWIAPFIAPPGEPRTKPRALNAALMFERAPIVGILDAEDQPEPDQIRKAAATLAAAPPEVVAVQARLRYYNPRDSLISRAFAVDYAGWFHFAMPGFEAMGAPTLLGGTSCYFKREALIGLGGWDAWNVTEDADLGVRIRRFGWRTALIDSDTSEEAVAQAGPWVRQRGRWLLGFMTTWITHMRTPLRTLREMGPLGFLCFQTLTLGTMLGFVLSPALAISVGLSAYSGRWSTGWMDAALLAAFVALVALHALAGWRAYGACGARWAALTPFYWLLGFLAALRAIWRLCTAPTVWDKTEHGLCSDDARLGDQFRAGEAPHEAL